MAYQPWTTDKREGEKASQNHEDNVNHIDDVKSGLKKGSGKANYTASDQTDENEPHGCGDGGCECRMDEIEATPGRLSVVSIAEQLLDNLEREIPDLEIALDEESDALMRSKTFHSPDSGTETADSLFAAANARVSTMKRLDFARGVKKACMLAINELGSQLKCWHEMSDDTSSLASGDWDTHNLWKLSEVEYEQSLEYLERTLPEKKTEIRQVLEALRDDHKAKLYPKIDREDQDTIKVDARAVLDAKARGTLEEEFGYFILRPLPIVTCSTSQGEISLELPRDEDDEMMRAIEEAKQALESIKKEPWNPYPGGVVPAYSLAENLTPALWDADFGSRMHGLYSGASISEHDACTSRDADIGRRIHGPSYYVQGPGPSTAFTNFEDVYMPECAVAEAPALLSSFTAAGKRPVNFEPSTTGNVQVGGRYRLNALLNLEEQSRVHSSCLGSSCVCEDCACKDYGYGDGSSPDMVVNEGGELLDDALNECSCSCSGREESSLLGQF